MSAVRRGVIKAQAGGAARSEWRQSQRCARYTRTFDGVTHTPSKASDNTTTVFTSAADAVMQTHDRSQEFAA